MRGHNLVVSPVSRVLKQLLSILVHRIRVVYANFGDSGEFAGQNSYCAEFWVVYLVAVLMTAIGLSSRTGEAS